MQDIRYLLSKWPTTREEWEWRMGSVVGGGRARWQQGTGCWSHPLARGNYPEPDHRTRKSSPRTGRNLEQDQVHTGGLPVDGWLSRGGGSTVNVGKTSNTILPLQHSGEHKAFLARVRSNNAFPIVLRFYVLM